MFTSTAAVLRASACMLLTNRGWLPVFLDGWVCLDTMDVGRLPNGAGQLSGMPPLNTHQLLGLGIRFYALACSAG